MEFTAKRHQDENTVFSSVSHFLCIRGLLMKRSAMLAAALMCVCSPIIAQSELDSNSNTEWNLNSNQDPNSLQTSETFDLAPNPRSEISNRSTSRRTPEAIATEPSQKLELPANNSAAPIAKPDSNPAGLPTGHRLHQRSLMQGNSVANTVPNYQHSQGNFYPGHDSEFLPFGSPANSPLLSYMQCDTYGQAAWAGYPCERARALAHQFRHVNGQCSCLNGCRSLSDHYCTGASCQPSCGVVNRYRPSCDQPVCAQPASDCDQPLGIGSGDHPALPPGPFIQQSRLPQNERRIAEQIAPPKPVKADDQVATLWPLPTIHPNTPPRVEPYMPLPKTAQRPTEKR